MAVTSLTLKKLEVKSFVTLLANQSKLRFVGGSESLEDDSCVSGDPTSNTFESCPSNQNQMGVRG